MIFSMNRFVNLLCLFIIIECFIIVDSRIRQTEIVIGSSDEFTFFFEQMFPYRKGHLQLLLSLIVLTRKFVHLSEIRKRLSRLEAVGLTTIFKKTNGLFEYIQGAVISSFIHVQKAKIGKCYGLIKIIGACVLKFLQKCFCQIESAEMNECFCF